MMINDIYYGGMEDLNWFDKAHHTKHTGMGPNLWSRPIEQ